MKLIILLSAMAAFVGCSDFNNFYKEKKSDYEPVSGGSEVVAVIGSQEITLDELMDAVNNLPLKQKKIYLSSEEKLNEFLEAYINKEVIYSEALRRGIDRREDITGRTENFKKQLIGQAFAQDIFNEINVSESDIQRYYENNKEEFERVGISIIFIKSDPEQDGTEGDALARARLISQRAQAGYDFGQLAREYSEDTESIKRGSRVGYVEKGRYPPHIEEVIFSMEEGEISKPLEVEDGFYIIKIDKKEVQAPEGQIKRKIRSDLVNKKVIEYVNRLREEWGVLIFEDKLRERVKSD